MIPCLPTILQGAIDTAEDQDAPKMALVDLVMQLKAAKKAAEETAFVPQEAPGGGRVDSEGAL